jgi:hypothetical protein
MKVPRIHLPNISFLAAFVIGVILFAVIVKNVFGSASNAMILAGMAGVAVAVSVFRIRQELRSPKKEK